MIAFATVGQALLAAGKFLFGTKLGRGILIAIAIGAAVLAYGHYREGKGYDQAIADVAADNREAKGRVDQALSRIRECRGRGGTWSTVSGLCE